MRGIPQPYNQEKSLPHTSGYGTSYRRSGPSFTTRLLCQQRSACYLIPPWGTRLCPVKNVQSFLAITRPVTGSSSSHPFWTSNTVELSKLFIYPAKRARRIFSSREYSQLFCTSLLAQISCRVSTRSACWDRWNFIYLMHTPNCWDQVVSQLLE